MKIDRLLVVTGNEGKAREFEELLCIESIEVQHKSLPILEIQSLDIHEIGNFKTEAVFNFPSEIQGFDAVLTDDTSLVCKGLNGLPGPLIKWFLQKLGPLGILNLIGDKSREAEAICLLTLGFPASKEVYQFEGNVQGRMVAPNGELGFGWDPIFQPLGFDRTYAQFSLEEKNKFSHRALAVTKLRDWILSKKS